MNEILFVTGSLVRGGAQRVMTLLANKYAQKGWRVHIAMLLRNEVGYQLCDGIHLHDLSGNGAYTKNVARWITSLHSLMVRLRPDVVVSFAGRINLITLLATAGTGIPVLISERNDPAHDRRSPLERQLCRVYYKKADCVVFQTSYQQQYYGKRCQHNSLLIGNPIAAPIYKGAHPSGDILSVGKLMPQKNHQMLIRAFSKIADRHPDTRVHIWGEGSQRIELQTMIDSLGMSGRILLEGNSSQIFEEMQKCRYFVMTSNYEGLSNALLEAMMSGMTCISTDWSGIEDFAENGKNLLLVHVGDIEGLAVLLDEVLSGKRANLASAGIETAKKFCAEQIMEQWSDAIERIMK